MCDYSLETYRSRPAQLGEKYETHKFPSFSIGFIAPGDPSTACAWRVTLNSGLKAFPRRFKSLFRDAKRRRYFHSVGRRSTSRWSALWQWCAVTLQQLGTGVQGWVLTLCNRLSRFGRHLRF